MFLTMVLFILATVAMAWLRTREGYENWDFMDFAGMCSLKKRKTAEEIPHFGGVPSSADVWTI